MFRARTAGLHTALHLRTQQEDQVQALQAWLTPSPHQRCFPAAPDSKGDGSIGYPTPMPTGALVSQCSPLAIDSHAVSCESSQVSRDVSKVRATKLERFVLFWERGRTPAVLGLFLALYSGSLLAVRRPYVVLGIEPGLATCKAPRCGVSSPVTAPGMGNWLCTGKPRSVLALVPFGKVAP